MSLKTRILPYLGQDGLVGPKLMNGQGSSDNALMFHSEYLIMENRQPENKLFSIIAAEFFQQHLEKSQMAPGCLARHPGDFSSEGPDDYLGVLAFCKEFGIKTIPQQMLSFGYRNFGFFSTKERTGETWLWRQIQITTAMLMAAGVPSILYPLGTLYTAAVIATSKLNKEDLDGPRLNWLLIQITRDNLVCKLAAKIWYKRFKKVFPGGMREVAYKPEGLEYKDCQFCPEKHSGYYHNNHPFGEFWEENEILP